MKLSQRVVTKIPLDAIWTDQEALNAKRAEYLGQGEISKLLQTGPIQFVLANMGDKLVWKNVNECYKLYKTDLKDHIINDADDIDLTQFKDGFGYLASRWTGDFEIPIVVLEKFH